MNWLKALEYVIQRNTVQLCSSFYTGEYCLITINFTYPHKDTEITFDIFFSSLFVIAFLFVSFLLYSYFVLFSSDRSMFQPFCFYYSIFCFSCICKKIILQHTNCINCTLLAPYVFMTMFYVELFLHVCSRCKVIILYDFYLTVLID